MVKIYTQNNKTIIERPFDKDNLPEFPFVVTAEWFNVNLPIIRGVGTSHLEFYYNGRSGVVAIKDIISTITILPPLPRNPTEKDIPLLYRYMVEGIYPRDKLSTGDSPHLSGLILIAATIDCYKIEITHCTDSDGNIVEVAFRE
jgi:hypothetical protein